MVKYNEFLFMYVRIYLCIYYRSFLETPLQVRPLTDSFTWWKNDAESQKGVLFMGVIDTAFDLGEQITQTSISRTWRAWGIFKPNGCKVQTSLLKWQIGSLQSLVTKYRWQNNLSGLPRISIYTVNHTNVTFYFWLTLAHLNRFFIVFISF